jgi:hypothetical protein
MEDIDSILSQLSNAGQIIKFDGGGA